MERKNLLQVKIRRKHATGNLQVNGKNQKSVKGKKRYSRHRLKSEAPGHRKSKLVELLKKSRGLSTGEG